jgi:tetratricopeptide (TPR) repeat protein
MFLRRFLLATALFAATASCASQLSLAVTPPDATVNLEPLSGGSKKEIGKGSAVFDGDVLGANGASLPLLLSVQKEGFQDWRMLLTSLPSGPTQITVSLQPLPDPLQVKDKKDNEKDKDQSEKNSEIVGLADPAKINEIVRLVLEAERYLLEQNLEKALEIASRLQASSPQLSVAFALEGAALYAQRKLPEARGAWQRAAALDPSDLSTRAFLTRLENEMGIGQEKSR